MSIVHIFTLTTLNMKLIRNFTLLLGILLMASQSYSQTGKKKVYFLADTINIPKTQRLVEIGNDYGISYTFLCRCLMPVTKGGQNEDLIYYFVNNKDAKLNISDTFPKVRYMSWKEFLNLAVRPRFFSDNYEFYITEVLPQNKYRTNKVEFFRPTTIQTIQKID